MKHYSHSLSTIHSNQLSMVGAATHLEELLELHLIPLLSHPLTEIRHH